MRLKALLTSVMLIASPSWAQQPPSALPEASSSEKERTQNQIIAAGASTQPIETTPVSIARVRAALEKPPPILAPPDRKADFFAHIDKRLPLQELFDSPPWATPAVAWGGGGIDPIKLIRSAMRAYAERAAREEVKRAIADYCAAQPNAGAGIRICSSAPAIR